MFFDEGPASREDPPPPDHYPRQGSACYRCPGTEDPRCCVYVAVVTALLAASGVVAVTYTQASPTPATAFGAIVNLRQQVHSAAGEPPTVLICHPRRLAQLDETMS